MSATFTTGPDTMSPTPTPEPTAAELGIRARELDQLCVDTIRMLAVDMTNAADSGHPGLPMGAADMAYVLWTKHLRFDPSDPAWRDRDRFVLSAGHGCALQYGLLHLSGYDLSLDELRRFRQLGSKTPGHPEAHVTPGVEVTTGPLGQGVANAVGIAVAEAMMGARFNSSDFAVSSHRVFAIVGDGCLMEGISSEAASMAGHWGLGNLKVLYDSNRISIDGSTDLAFTEDVTKRFEAARWRVLSCDGNDRAAVAAALDRAVAETSRPTLVICRTVIGKGSPNRQGTEKAHGSPLGGEETKLTKAAYGWPTEPTFVVPREVRDRFATLAAEKKAQHRAWDARIAAWKSAKPAEFARWDSMWKQTVPTARQLLDATLAGWSPGPKATRSHSEAVIQKMAAQVPALVGGSADLTGSNNNWIAGAAAIGPTKAGQTPSPELFTGRNFYFGVREHAMGAVVNGIAAHGAFVPFCATFLQFLDYMKPAVRLASLSHHGSIFLYSHDSVGLGEDGPTHQPIEHLWSARMIPGITVHRPADSMETAAAWADAIARRDRPTLIATTRQKLPEIPRPAGFDAGDLLRGGYVAAEASREAEVVLIATGSEVGVAMEAKKLLEEKGVATRVVSMPSVEVFDRQDAAWKAKVLPEGPARVAIEAGRPDGWYRFVGRDGLVIGIEDFGISAPAPKVFEKFGITGPQVAARVAGWLAAG
jgi:transketolase